MSKVIAKITIEAGQGGGKTLSLDFLQRMFQTHGVTVSRVVDDERETSLWIECQDHFLAPTGIQLTATQVELMRREHEYYAPHGARKTLTDPILSSPTGAPLLFTPVGKAATYLAIEEAVTSVIGPAEERLHRARTTMHSLASVESLRAPSTFAHTLKKCPEDCGGCQFCDGGLSYCEVCHGGEGDLPKDCPGRAMVDSEMMEISAGKLDFVDGQWVSKGKLQ